MNLRDLGGYAGADGRNIKQGLLYRSGALGETTPAELALLETLGLAHILDLRCADEAEELPDPQIPGAEHMRISGAMDADDNEINLSPARIYGLLFNPRRIDDDDEENLMSQVAEIYTSLAFDNIAYRHLFYQLECENVPLLFHCSAGKDRTSIAAMLILLALGVEDKTIVADYALTNRYRREAIDGRLKDHSLLSKVPLFETIIRASEGVLPEFGVRVLDEIKQEHGDYGTFLRKEYGLTPKRIERLRAMYLE